MFPTGTLLRRWKAGAAKFLAGAFTAPFPFPPSFPCPFPPLPAISGTRPPSFAPLWAAPRSGRKGGGLPPFPAFRFFCTGRPTNCRVPACRRCTNRREPPGKRFGKRRRRQCRRFSRRRCLGRKTRPWRKAFLIRLQFRSGPPPLLPYG